MAPPEVVCERVLTDEADTAALAADLALHLRPGDFVALHGDLGAGKTTFVRALAAALGGDPREVSSPTYAIVHVHRLPLGPLVHADLYRLAGAVEVADLELADQAEGGLLVVEWPERAVGALGEPDLTVELDLPAETAPPAGPLRPESLSRRARVRMRDATRARPVRDTCARRPPKS